MWVPLNSCGRLTDIFRTATVCCFCAFCEQQARGLGIDFARVRQGYLALEKYVRAGRAGQRPVDGYYVAFWRVLLEYPEVLVWERFWNNGLWETYEALHGKVKSVREDLQAGWHIWHNTSFNPLYRAEQDFAAMAPYSDYVKPVLYNNCAGYRLHHHVQVVAGLKSCLRCDLFQVVILQIHSIQFQPGDMLRRGCLVFVRLQRRQRYQVNIGMEFRRRVQHHIHHLQDVVSVDCEIQDLIVLNLGRQSCLI